MEDITTRVNEFIEGHGDMSYMDSLLAELIKIKNQEALSLVIRMVENDYGGITLKGNFQTFACIATVFWGKAGIEALSNMAVKNASYRNLLNVPYFLAHVAANKIESYHYYQYNTGRKILKNKDIITIASDEEVILSAREGLVEIVRAVEQDDMFPTGMITSLQFPTEPLVQQTYFAALVTRWFHFSKGGISEYLNLIRENHLEEVYHSYIKSNDNILEPFATKIWSKPKFGEKLIPDFLIQSIDDSYTVVEIEKPTLNIITKAGNLSAEATHAKKQVLDYQDWLIRNHLYAKEQYPNISKPFGLVVIGLEENLNAEQKEQLRKENESTAGNVKIVGFDWLYNRAKSSFDNMIKVGFTRGN